LGGAANFDQCLHIVMVIVKCTYIVQEIFWLRGAYVGEAFLGGIFMGKENFHEGGAGYSSII